MRSLTCPGLPASWLNGWLAAVGATVLDTSDPASLDRRQHARGRPFGRGY